MPTTLTCRECGASNTFKEKPKAKSLRCKKCDAPLGESEKSGGPNWLLIGLLGCGVVSVGVGVLAVGIVAVVLLTSGSSTTATDASGKTTASTTTGGKSGSGKSGGGNSGGELPAGVLQAPSVYKPFDNQGYTFIERFLIGNSRAVVVYRSNTGDQVHLATVLEIATGMVIGRFQLTDVKVPQQMAFSPDGTRLAVVEMLKKPGGLFGRGITVWSVPDGQALFTRWEPYEVVAYSDPRFAELALTWCCFLDAKRLLTVTDGGRVDLWSVPDHKGLYQKRPIQATGNGIMRTDIYTHMPQSFALNADRSMLAMHNGSIFTLVNTANGEAIRSTSKPNLGAQPAVKGTAFSPDGKSLAVVWQSVPSGKTYVESNLVTWNTVSGVEISSTTYKALAVPINALAWWGPSHIVGRSGTPEVFVVYDTAAKGFFRQGFLPLGGRMGLEMLDGKLWCAVTNTKQAYIMSFADPASAARADPGALDGSFLKRWWLTPRGIETQPEGQDNRPTIHPKMQPGGGG